MYKHRQIGKLIRTGAGALLVIPLVAFLYVPTNASDLFLTLAAVVLGELVVFIFSCLTTQVSDGVFRWHFGFGMWKNSVLVSDIVSATVVKNPWWYGWGIHYYGKGWLYNVQGFTAVEIVLKDGTQMRIGTDEPAALVRTLGK